MQNTQRHLEAFLQTAEEEITRLAQTLNESFYRQAVAAIIEAERRGNRMHITGVGKPAHVANYIASLLCSTGTPCYYLHATEAVHGSCGQLREGDLVICISNSGETEELKSTVSSILQNNCTILAVTGAPESWLAQRAKITLLAQVQREGGPLDRAPRASVLSEILVLQGLSVVLQSQKGISPQQYVRWHPHGALGRL